MAFKNAKSLRELERMTESNLLLNIADLKDEHRSNGLYISTFTMDDLDVERERCGLAGSPTNVHKVESIVLAGNEHEPTWSPDQRRIAYAVDIDQDNSNDSIFILDLETGSKNKLTNGVLTPKWSPVKQLQ